MVYRQGCGFEARWQGLCLRTSGLELQALGIQTSRSRVWSSPASIQQHPNSKVWNIRHPRIARFTEGARRADEPCRASCASSVGSRMLQSLLLRGQASGFACCHLQEMQRQRASDANCALQQQCRQHGVVVPKSGHLAMNMNGHSNGIVKSSAYMPRIAEQSTMLPLGKGSR